MFYAGKATKNAVGGLRLIIHMDAPIVFIPFLPTPLEFEFGETAFKCYDTINKCLKNA